MIEPVEGEGAMELDKMTFVDKMVWARLREKARLVDIVFDGSRHEQENVPAIAKAIHEAQAEVQAMMRKMVERQITPPIQLVSTCSRRHVKPVGWWQRVCWWAGGFDKEKT